METRRYEVRLRGAFPRVTPSYVRLRARDNAFAILAAAEIVRKANSSRIGDKRYTSWTLHEITATGFVCDHAIAQVTGV